MTSSLRVSDGRLMPALDSMRVIRSDPRLAIRRVRIAAARLLIADYPGGCKEQKERAQRDERE